MNKTKQLFSLRLLSWFCPPHLLEEIEGDLMQRYERDVKVFGERRARRRLLWNVIRFFRPAILLRNKFSMNNNQANMIQNYFITSIRHIKKSKVNFGFKLGGLTLAVFSFLSIAIYVAHQISFDTHHVDYKNIYRVNSQRTENGQIEKYAIVPLGIGPLLKQYIPEIESYARTRYANGSYLRYEGKAVSCGGLLEADSTLFGILNFGFIEGDSNALKVPNGIVLTKPIAQNMFGTDRALGKLITINNEKKVYQVSAVIDKPSHTCFGFEAIILNQTELPLTLNSIASPVEFLDNSATLFVRLKKPVTDELTSKIESLLDRFIKKSDRNEAGFNLSFQSIANIYLAPELKAEFARKGSIIYVYAFSTLGVLLLIVAGINYYCRL
jgi:putative ABC transport system permease protein